MKSIREHPIFACILAFLAIAMLAEAWLLYSGGKTRDGLDEELKRRVSEIEQLQRQKPAPIEENLRSVKDDFDHSAVVLSTMLKSLNVVGADELEYFKGEPATSVEAYFDIRQFVERMHTAAEDVRVSLRADEHFGFSAYSHVGPEPALIRSVYRQRRIVEYLLGKLIAARPRSILFVQREEPERLAATKPATPPARPVPASQPGAAGTGDIFTIDPQVSARTPGYVDTLSFRIGFSGQTAALRGFMNALAAPEIPLVVRSVEVSTVTADAQRQSGNRPGQPPPNLFPNASGSGSSEISQGSVPIVPESEGNFIVTVELFEVKIRAPAVSATP